MDYLHYIYSEYELYDIELWIGDWMFVVSIGVLMLELIRLAVKRTLGWNLIGDSVTNFITFYAFIGLTILMAAGYVAVFYFVYENFSIGHLPTNGWTLLACVVAADLAYYFEHRFTHRTGIGWATHSVHHSSPYFNISVAYRFGPLDGFFPLFFHLPLAVIGFNPAMIFLAEIIVAIYQTLLHTELVGKLPRPIEAVMNTPSHHRVHHGRNPSYIDKNYAGMFIFWDRWFGTFAEEKETVEYGITKPLHSVNPLVVFFHGITRLYTEIKTTPSWKTKTSLLWRPPH